MILQYILVIILIAWALSVTLFRVVQFFRVPPSRCHGCSGCELKSANFHTFDRKHTDHGTWHLPSKSYPGPVKP